ncbi:hypothetical protein HMPREF1621_01036 [Escherichia coli A25922R]|jgi:hypothetical protein|uniref:Uncharacterized protein n=8 Tax=Escherichia coli TaxID=562 RepID=A0A0H2VFX6_ECOL6|nr:Hypothetical protein c5129 [Escherichia coli CFT073]ABE10125.1 hypothetical protein UTI89_C4717 [Escherichia coli UTI89]ABG72310.1 hypothetical protein ECP_4366 [Escherichia coli 536]ACB16895.1 hypothetical protein EcSMS35_4590 [Escherichia coli SMS-3-5]ADE89477.1 hypothetical protein ECOK1_4635 [Escherichia coli IHE3034]ADN49068.1 hypothetical protein ECABU_c46760 [Escherichia coli ABU 83972]AEQ15510.1 hypothetical protein CE10_4840 [Escherichia coli O7:K1 str. CE10]AJB37413.1 hypothetic
MNCFQSLTKYPFGRYRLEQIPHSEYWLIKAAANLCTVISGFFREKDSLAMGL